VTQVRPMPASLYKYIGPSTLGKVFAADAHVTLRCSYPKDFNDPYELFLTIDFNEQPDALAFYADAVGEIPQYPTTCFSRSPAVVPMWAHYARNLEGFVIEFSEAELVTTFPKSGFGDVDYQDEPDKDLSELLYRAFEIGKPRYMYFLHKAVLSAAYYTKSSCWSYEQERRMVARDNETRSAENLILMDVPYRCVTSLIAGPRASPDLIAALRQRATQIGCKYLQTKIGRLSSAPYFMDSDGTPYVFHDDQLRTSPDFCGSCKEPITDAAESCSWCQIEDSHRAEAATRNPYRMFAHYGMLESYIEGMEAISRGARKK
jgi:Protein of unknown function (DUF2971)